MDKQKGEYLFDIPPADTAPEIDSIISPIGEKVDKYLFILISFYLLPNVRI